MISCTDLQRLLVVADASEYQRRTLRHQLNSLGYQYVFEADSGAEALALCQQKNIDVVFCELQMPGMDGMALLRQLSLAGFRGAVIIASVLDNDLINSVLLMGQHYGLNMLGSLRKPTTVRQIKALIASRHPQAQPESSSGASIIPPDELRRALDNGDIRPWYQPKVAFKSGEWLGTEALARWKHPERGFIPPSEFIPLAEQHGLIDELTDMMFRQAMKDAHLWGQSELSVNLSLNLSTRSLLSTGLFDTILGYCRQWSVSPQMITLEVTENALMEDVGQSLETLARMRMHGFGLSIDDFGTGYSSVQQLTMLPFTELKLDRYFISRCFQDASCMAVIEYSLNLAQQLGLKSV
ncbi:EAL domain-containing protein, partial [Buttiauxella warmboldiae]